MKFKFITTRFQSIYPITNENGEILHTTDTLAYGEELTAPYEDQNDKVLNTITYTGHEKDYETNFTYMLARYYSQGYGRFLSPDPGYDYDQLDPMSWNLYSYVRGNPVMRIDPDGRQAPTVENARKLEEQKIRALVDKAKARMTFEIQSGRAAINAWSSGTQLTNPDAPQLVDGKKEEERKKSLKKINESIEKENNKKKSERIEMLENVADNTTNWLLAAGTVSLASPVTAPIAPTYYTAAGISSTVSWLLSEWKAEVCPTNENKLNAKQKRISMVISVIISKIINKLPLSDEENTFFNITASQTDNATSSSDSKNE